MQQAKYRDKSLEGYEDIELDLPPDMLAMLEERAIREDKTVDQVVEELIMEFISDHGLDEEHP